MTPTGRMLVADFTVTYADQFNDYKGKDLALKHVTSLSKLILPICINFQYYDGQPADYDHKTFSRQTLHHQVIFMIKRQDQKPR